MSQYDGWLHSGLPSPYDGQLHESGPLATGGPIVITRSGTGLSSAAAAGTAALVVIAGGGASAAAAASGESAASVPQTVSPDPIGTSETVGQPTVTAVSTQPTPRSPPAWSSIGKPTPRRPRRRERERRLITTTSRLRVECDSRVRAAASSSTALSSRSIATTAVRAHRVQVMALVSIAGVRAVATARSTLRSDIEVAVSRRDAPELEALLLGLL